MTYDLNLYPKFNLILIQTTNQRAPHSAKFVKYLMFFNVFKYSYQHLMTLEFRKYMFTFEFISFE